MRHTREFSAFGVNYRTKQFSAVRGLEILSLEESAHPCDRLSGTEVKVKSGWVSLANIDAINTHVQDMAKVLPARVVLEGVMSLVSDFNFDFLTNWTPAKVPKRFIDGAASVSSENTEPMISQLIQDDAAKLRDLEEYYSLHDAFKMFDILMVKGINAALAHEAAMKRARSK